MIEKNKHMLKEVLDFPSLMEAGIKAANEFPHEVPGGKKIYWIGMGASGLVGDYIQAYVSGKGLNVEIEVIKTHLAPRREGFFVIYSYSGNTLETLRAMVELLNSGRKDMLVVSSGGKASEYAAKHGIPVLKLPPGYQSRSHVPFGIAAMAKLVLRGIGEEKLASAELTEALSAIKDVASEHESLLAGYLELSKEIIGRKYVPVILGDAQIAPVPLRFRNQFSENSKVFSLSDVFPEIGHNLLCSLTKSEHAFPIIIKRESADEVIKAYYEILRETLENKRKFEIFVNDGKFGWKTLLHPTFLGDLLSIALAEINEADAREIPEVAFVKKWLKKVIMV